MRRTDELKNFLRERAENGIALAFSGGVDSTLLLSILTELRAESPFRLLALTMNSIFQHRQEIDEVKAMAEESAVELEIFNCDPLSIPEVKNNPPERCYWCKRYIFNKFSDFARKHEIKTLIDGTNADDRNVYRPGRRALSELGVVSPLAELGFSKREIRSLANERNLRCSAKPSMPCLATRFEYGANLTCDRLEQVAEGEGLIRRSLPETADVRLRVHADIARIEVSAELLPMLLARRNEISAGLHKLGFQFVTLDLDGFRSGCFDKTGSKTAEE